MYLQKITKLIKLLFMVIHSLVNLNTSNLALLDYLIRKNTYFRNSMTFPTPNLPMHVNLCSEKYVFSKYIVFIISRVLLELP